MGDIGFEANHVRCTISENQAKVPIVSAINDPGRQSENARTIATTRCPEAPEAERVGDDLHWIELGAKYSNAWTWPRGRSLSRSWPALGPSAARSNGDRFVGTLAVSDWCIDRKEVICSCRISCYCVV